MAIASAPRAAARPWLGGWHLLVPIVALAATRDLWAPDEPRYAQIAREAVDSGSLLVLHLCGDVYPDKPPLVYWLAGVFGRLTEWSAFALRIPLILATLGSALLAARIARRHLGETAAAWAPVFYLGTAMVAWFGGRLQLDPLLAFFCLAAIDLIWNDAGTSAQRGRRLLLAGLCTGLAALAKGPVAFLHVGLAVAALWWVPRTARAPLRASAAAWAGFAVLAILPVAAWAVAASLREPALWKPLFVGQHLGRATDAEAPHAGPPWEHLWQMPGLFFPWTGLLVLGVAELVRAFRAREVDARRASLLRMGAWFAAVFVVFSVMPPKRELYLLPIYAAGAWLAAVAFERALRDGRLTHWVTAPTTAVFLAAGVAALAVPPFVPAVQPYTRTIFPVAVALIGASVAGFVFLRRRDLGRWADSIAVGFSAAGLAAALWVIPAVDEVKSPREFAQVIAARPEKPARIPCVGVQPEGYRFYGGVPTVRSHAAALVEDFERGGADRLALVAERDWLQMPASTRSRFEILAQHRVGSRSVLLLGRAPASGI